MPHEAKQTLPGLFDMSYLESFGVLTGIVVDVFKFFRVDRNRSRSR